MRVVITDLITVNSIYVTQSGIDGTFTVELTRPENVTIQVTSKNSYVSIVPNSLTFTTINYSTPQTVTLSTNGSTFNGVAEEMIYLRSGRSYGSFKLKVADNNIDSSIYNRNPDDDFHWATESQLNTLRSDTIDWIWGNGLPTDLPVNWGVFTGDAFVSLVNFTNLDSAQRGEVVLGGTWIVYLYHFIPTTSNGKIMLHAAGHGDNWAGISNNKMDDCCEYFVAQGYDVIFWYMVGRGPNPTGDGVVQGVGGNGGTHDQMRNLESPTFNPIEYFLNPSIYAVNYAVNQGFTNINFTGISGGGWTALWACFLDVRIDKGFSLAGYNPNFINEVLAPDGYDYEQGWQGTDMRSSAYLVAQYESVTHMDMICGASQGREYYQWNNINDSCCFEGYYNTVYKYNIKDKLNSIGSYDSFLYDEPGKHTYTNAILTQIDSLI